MDKVTEIFQSAEGLLNIGTALKKHNTLLGEMCLFLAHQTLSTIEPDLKDGNVETKTKCNKEPQEKKDSKQSAFHNLPVDAQKEVKENVDNILKRIKDAN